MTPMYSHILVAIEHSDADQAVLAHIEQLAALTHARLLLVHVADGWAARTANALVGNPAESPLIEITGSQLTVQADADLLLAVTPLPDGVPQ